MGLFGAIAGLGGSLFGGLFGSHGAGKASKQYIQGLQQAQRYLQGLIPQATAPYAPFLSAGEGASTLLSSMLSTPGEGLLTPWTQAFTAPTAEEARATPGYQFQLEEGEKALQNSAAGRGSLLSGRTLADVNRYAQGLADSTYNDTFNRSLTEYQSAYNTFLNNQNNTYSRLLGLGGMGLSAAGGTSGAIQDIGNSIASLYSQQGAARAGGTLSSTNSILGMIPGLTSSLASLFGSFGKRTPNYGPSPGQPGFPG